MKKIIYGALLCALATTAQANLVSNQTFVRSRDSLSHNALMNLTGRTWTGSNNKNVIGSFLSVAPYYRTSYNKTDLAAALAGGQAVNGDQNGQLVIEPNQSISFEDEALHLHSAAIDHMATEVDGGMYGVLTLNPSRTEYGAHISWQQKLDFAYKGLSLHIDIPVACVRHDLGTVLSGSAHNDSSSYGQNGSTLLTYFSGQTLIKSASSSQQALAYARIDGSSHSLSGIADIQAGLNYTWYTSRSLRISTKGYVVIPTGAKETSVNLFEPAVGCGHVALGARGLVMGNIFHTRDNAHRVNAYAMLDYRYLFQSEKTRTLGIYNHWFNTVATGSQYHNVGVVGGTQAVPAANVLTRTVLVKPGQLFDGVIGARYNYKEFGFSLAYNLHAHDAEAVTLTPPSRWFDGTYGMLGHSHSVSSAIIVGSNSFTYGGAIQQQGNTSAISKNSSGADVGSDNAAQYYVTTDVCSGRSDLTHKLGATGEWHYRKMRFPVNISIGAEYEFPGLPTTNSGIHSWAVWSKLSVCF